MKMKFCIILFLHGIFLISKHADAAAGGEEDTELVHAKVNTNAIIPCNIEILTTEPDAVLTITWNKKSETSLFLASAQKDNGTLSVTYLTESLQTKYQVKQDYELEILNVRMQDSSDYTCQVIKFLDESRGAIDERFQNTTSLLVQDVPSVPGRPLMSNLQSRSVSISWDKSLKENNSPITGYIVQVRSLSDEWKSARNITVGSPTTTINVIDLRPYRSYVLRIIAINSCGQSQPSGASDIFVTPSEVPEAPPRNLRAISEKSSYIDIKWEPPEEDKINGILKGYEIIYGITGENVAQPLTVEDKDKTSILVPLVRPYTEYFVSVKAVNDAGAGPEAVTYVITAEGIPSQPRIIQVHNTMSTSFYVKWEAPQKLNGNLIRYELKLKHNNIIRTKTILGGFSNPMTDFISKLEPYTQYQISVRAVTNGGPGEYSEPYPVVTDVAGPGPPLLLNYTVLGPDSVYLIWAPPDKKQIYREVDKYIVTFSDTKSFSSKQVAVNGSVRETIITGLPTNREYNMKLAGATKSLYTMTSKTLYVGQFTDPVIINLIGEDNVLVYMQDTGEENVTATGEENTTATDPTAIAQQEQDVTSAGIIAGIVCVVLFILLGSLVFIGCRSMTCQKYYHTARNYLAVPTNSNSPPTTVIVVADAPEEHTYDEVKVEDFVKHVKDLHANSDDLFSQEFEDINKHTRVDLKAECSNQPENRNKNRYINITAFDHSRVQLRPINGRLRSSDYINANYVDGYGKQKAYIATQGPLPQTFADFWRMIWEQNSLVIIMITNIMERGRRKCDKYWPEEGIEQHGPISVKHINTFSRSHYTVRIFSLKNTKIKKQFSERIVHQFHYTEWPDHGVPDFTLPVLKFVQKSSAAAHNPPGQGPIVIHCSAGVGRTGTYILIDSMIQKMKDLGTINVPQFLLHIRKQRNFLVQTEDQYMLIHDALVEYIISGGDTEVKKSDLTKFIGKLTDKEDGMEESLLDKQYKLATSYKPKEADKSVALKNFNTDKNRDEELLPLNVKRVSLPFKPGEEGSNYINATYLQGYNKTDEFILTQHPLESTVEDFWRMVWDQNSSVILLLSPLDDDEFKKFWPEKDEPIEVDTGNFKLGFREEEETAHYVVREFLLESTQDDYILMTRVFSCKEWPRKDLALYKAFDMVETVKDLHRQNDIGPIIVIDKYGGVQGSKFCALCALHDQLMHDKAVDVYHLCKLFHTKRPGIIGSKEDYMFLYEALESFYQDQTEKESNSFSHHLHLRGSSKKNGSLPKSPTLSAKIETNV